MNINKSVIGLILSLLINLLIFNRTVLLERRKKERDDDGRPSSSREALNDACMWHTKPCPILYGVTGAVKHFRHRITPPLYT